MLKAMMSMSAAILHQSRFTETQVRAVVGTALVVLLVASSAMAQTQAAPEGESVGRVVQLLEDSGYRYTKQRSWLWSMVFTGQQLPIVSVWVMTANDELIIQGVIALREQLSSAPDVMRQLVTRNGNGDGPALLIDDDGHYVARARLGLGDLDDASFTTSVQAIVAATDDAYGSIKPLLSKSGAVAPAVLANHTFAVPSGATHSRTILNNRASLSFNPAQWQETRTAEAGRLTFQHRNGNGHAVVIAEQVEIPTEQLRDIVLANMRKTGHDIQVVDEQHRRVNGADVLLLQTDLIVGATAFTYLGYYYGGPSGTVQVLTYIDRMRFASARRDFEDFLNGLRINP